MMAITWLGMAPRRRQSLMARPSSPSSVMGVPLTSNTSSSLTHTDFSTLITWIMGINSGVVPKMQDSTCCRPRPADQGQACPWRLQQLLPPPPWWQAAQPVTSQYCRPCRFIKRQTDVLSSWQDESSWHFQILIRSVRLSHDAPSCHGHMMSSHPVDLKFNMGFTILISETWHALGLARERYSV